MTSEVRRHIALVLADALKEHAEALGKRLQDMYSDHSAKGRLQSGATIRGAVGIMTEVLSEALDRTSNAVLAIARDAEACSAFEVAMTDLIEFSRDEMPTVIRLANGGRSEPNSSVETAAYELFGAMESSIERKIEIAKFSFDEKGTAVEGNLAARPSSKTGRPRGAFWDDMWASIARDLYVGDLQPKTQADVEAAMLQWIENHGHSAAVSTVRSRARRLWDLISAQ